MIDLHTHTLPAMDDGAKDLETSLEMLRRQRDQGVKAVALTSHFYRNREMPQSYLDRRQAAYEQLQQGIAQAEASGEAPFPKLILGAEVAYVPNLIELPELDQFCYAGTRRMLLELPFSHWGSQLFHELRDMWGRRGILPVIAHLDVYLKLQSPEKIQSILELGLPIQFSAEPLLHLLKAGSILKYIKSHDAYVIASDSHNLDVRPPILAKALQVVEHRLGPLEAQQLVLHSYRLLGLEPGDLPDSKPTV